MRAALLVAALAILLVAVSAQYVQQEPEDQFMVSAAYDELSQDLIMTDSPSSDVDDSDTELESAYEFAQWRGRRSCPRGFKKFSIPSAHYPYWRKHRHAHRFRFAGPNREFMCVPFNLVRSVEPIHRKLGLPRFRRRDPLIDPELRRITRDRDFAISAVGEEQVDPQEEMLSAAEVRNVQLEIQEEQQKEEQTLSPRMIRLRDLFQRGGVAMRKIKEGTAGVAELEELKAVRLGLTNEFNSYPAELQEQVRPAYNKINNALAVVIEQLQMKLKQKGIDKNVEIEALDFGSAEDIADDLSSLLTAVAAADFGIAPTQETDQFDTQGRRRGGWGFGGFGGFGGWGLGGGKYAGFGPKGFGRRGFGPKGYGLARGLGFGKYGLGGFGAAKLGLGVGLGGFGYGLGFPLGLGYTAPLALGYSGFGLGSWGYRGFGGFGFPFLGPLGFGSYGAYGAYGLPTVGLGYGIGAVAPVGGFGWF
jgi:hypothetical protein